MSPKEIIGICLVVFIIGGLIFLKDPQQAQVRNIGQGGVTQMPPHIKRGYS